MGNESFQGLDASVLEFWRFAMSDQARGDDRAVIALRGSVDGLLEALRT
jgi:hypothetical protein